MRQLVDLLFRYLPMILLLLLPSAMTSCAPNLCRGTRPILKVGLAAPFEGVARPLGYEALQGVKLAIAQWNAHGGPGGYMVELVALNDANDPQEARLQAEEFLADPAVLGVIAGWNAATAQAIAPILRQRGLATVLPWSVPAELADRGVVILAAHEGQIAQVVVEHLPLAVPRCHVAVVGDERAVAPYRALLPACVRSLAPPVASHRQALQTWVAGVLHDRSFPLEALILVVDSVLGGELVVALRQAGWSGWLFGAADLGSTQLTDVAGEWAEEVVIASPAPSGEDATFHSDEDRALFASLSPRGVSAYDAAHVLLAALERSVAQTGQPSRTGVIAALSGVQAQGLMGNLTFDPQGRRLHAPVWLYRVEGRRYPGVLVEQVIR
ncbi:MAG: ABC transporter substrate-binding protein [Anaerolineae bacterium]|nr:ABC transporter substrate-binding protein [Anaerolineae bacterium]MDW8072200.1 ABC transporter substrate-binding protein [Anaerolineae bacterium]